MPWIKTENILPEIKEGNWRTEEPVLVKLTNGDVTLAYYARVEYKENQIYSDIIHSPKFLCSDRYSRYYKDILDDQMEAWRYLPD